MEFDVVVVGAGTAGIACAISLAEAGVPRIAVIEKDTVVGGTLHLSSGQMSGSASRLQRSQGIDDSPEAHLADINRLGHGRADQALARLAVGEAGATIDWLEQLGFPFPADQPMLYYGHDPYTTARTYWGPEMGISILKAIQPRLEELVAQGRIDLRLGCALEELLVDGGRVTGVRAAAAGGGPVELRARNVALTTGGYAASRVLFDRLHPGIHVLLGARHTSQGEGLLAAERAGGAIRNADVHLSNVGGIETAFGEGVTDLWEALANTNAHYRAARELYVTAAGERYIAEDEPSQDAQERALMRIGGRMWLVFDEAAIGSDEQHDEAPLVVGWSAEMLREQAALGQIAWTADSLEELAAKAGIDPAGLARTVAEFNEACARGGGDPLGRRALDHPVAAPPFYALRTDGFTVISWAGLAVNRELRVTRSSGEPIPGLWAAGEILGASAHMGDAFCSGMAVTPALSLGRWLGRRLAAELA